MHKLLFSSLAVLMLLSGCTTHSLLDPEAKKEEPLYIDENTLILFALDAQNRGDDAQAVGYYDLLYERTKKGLYRDQAMGALIHGRYYDDVVERVLSMRQNSEEISEQDQRYFIIALLSGNEIESAKEEALTLVQKSPTEENYLILAEVYLLEKDYDKTLDVLEKGYGLNYSEQILDKIALLMYTNMNRRMEAVERLEQHIEHFGYSLAVTKRLAALYGDLRNEEGLLRTYPHLYDLDPTAQNAEIVIQLYWNAKKVPELTKFLERTGSNDALLLRIYSGEKRFSEAVVLAEKLYEETGEIDYLGQKAIFAYEAAKNKHDKQLLDSVISDLKKVVEIKEEGYYLNYLGYCMIEYDRDIEAGMAYVKRALAIEPDSGYFIDSLAWGYYKQGECEKAYELMKRVVEIMGDDDEEVKAHLKAIKKCKKGKK
ncbi:hypothetical protein [Sulfurimonas sp. HSL3-7]|uniref:hypothetical protein n=1 Tax=Sulfonitrofixus jiaomeiensis TaxID=3131938 RepID=UPI0031FA0081